MRTYLNKITGKILEEKEYEEMCIREYIWNYENNEDLAEDFPSVEDYIEYMKKNDNDTDFEVVEE